ARVMQSASCGARDPRRGAAARQLLHIAVQGYIAGLDRHRQGADVHRPDNRRHKFSVFHHLHHYRHHLFQPVVSELSFRELPGTSDEDRLPPQSQPPCASHGSGETPPMIRLENVCKTFDHIARLPDVTLEVSKGEVVCVIGPSGAGKSTMLRCINHLEALDSGTIYIEGQPVYRYMRDGKLIIDKEKRIEAIRAQVGMVFQAFNLFPHFTALENVMVSPQHVLREPLSELR